jgi:hypothetical protein
MRLSPLAFGALALTLLAAAPAAATPTQDIQQLFADYTRMWSAKDAEGVWSKIYRPSPGMAFQSAAGVARSLKGLTDQGYDHSIVNSVTPCFLTPADALVEFRYTRFKTDGQFMPPRLRAGVYVTHRYPDGWRITSILPMDAAHKLACS